MKVDYTNLSCI